MRNIVVAGLLLAMAMPAMAVPTLDVWLGVREVNSPQSPGTFGDTYTAGGTAGPNSIEAFGPVQPLVLDGTWQMFTFDVSPAQIFPTGSVTGDGIVDSDNSVLEHLGLGSQGFSGPITLWVDHIENTFDPTGFPPAQTVQVSTFDDDVTNPGNPYAAGTEVMFQEPSFSGSTSGNLVAGSVAGIDDTDGYDDTYSIKADFQFVDGDPSRWVRWTTYGGSGFQPERNPVIAEAGYTAYDSSTVTLWMKGVPEPASLSLLALGGLALLRRR